MKGDRHMLIYAATSFPLIAVVRGLGCGNQCEPIGQQSTGMRAGARQDPGDRGQKPGDHCRHQDRSLAYASGGGGGGTCVS